jgi:P pilus assembly chaperone PapD
MDPGLIVANKKTYNVNMKHYKIKISKNNMGGNIINSYFYKFSKLQIKLTLITKNISNSVHN